MANIDLIEKAARLLKPHKAADGRLFGDVGAVVVSREGNIYTGVCVDTPSWGLCAERSAVAMITHGEYLIGKVVAVWRNHDTGDVHVVPPCGGCREFMLQVDAGNLDAEIILGADDTRTLRSLLPMHEWPSPMV